MELRITEDGMVWAAARLRELAEAQVDAGAHEALGVPLWLTTASETVRDALADPGLLAALLAAASKLVAGYALALQAGELGRVEVDDRAAALDFVLALVERGVPPQA